DNYTGAAPVASIDLVKGPATQSTGTGGTATFTITVTNTGEVALTGVAVTDSLTAACARTIGSLAPGVSVTYTCARAGVTASFTNEACATGSDGGAKLAAAARTVSHCDVADVAVSEFQPPPPVRRVT